MGDVIRLRFPDWRSRVLVVLAVVVVALGALCVTLWRRAGAAEAELKRANDRAEQESKARRADVPIVQVVPQKVVNAEAEAALKREPSLLAAKKRLEKEIGDLNAYIAIVAQTDVMPARASLKEGEGIRLSLLGAGLEGDKGASALLLSVGVTREADGVEVGRGPLSVPLSSAWRADRAAPVHERAWRLGPIGGATGHGWVAGAAGTYRLDLWGWRPEAVAAAAGGAGGVVLFGGVMF